MTQFVDQPLPAPHPLGRRARVLLTGVFGPYAQDDEYGSRTLNPMELYHNQVTRVQGPFSLRMFHRSWGLMFIQANLQAPCVLLDFPSLERFEEELRTVRYDVIGISSIIPNAGKVAKMCELVRKHQPAATIVVGGHVANLPGLRERVGADWVVRGEGIRWFRHFLGEDPDRPILHPEIPTRIGTRSMGVSVRDKAGSVAATIVPSVGCPLGCNFCATSAMFGGKGKFVNFYQTGDELFDVMQQLESSLQSNSFFMLDENFLLQKRRALRLLELMQRHDKAWILYIFSSADSIRSYDMDQLVGLGVSWVWMGLEGENSEYTKLREADTFQLVRQLQSHGIRVLGSTIIGLERHTPENLPEAIDYAVRHETDFHQFMLYMPLPGTPLHADLQARGLLLDETQCPTADVHGQTRFNYRHPGIPQGQEGDLLLRAFEQDFQRNGPSMVRMLRTVLNGWQRHKQDPDPRVRRRYRREIEGLSTTYAAVVGAALRYYRDQPELQQRFTTLRDDLVREFGWVARLSASLGGRWLLGKIRREQAQLEAGWTYEPPTFYDCNEAAAKIGMVHGRNAHMARSVAAQVAPPAPTTAGHGPKKRKSAVAAADADDR